MLNGLNVAAGTTPLIRVDFTDDSTWQGIVRAIQTPSPDGFLPSISIVDCPQLGEMGTDKIVAAAAAEDRAVLFFADRMAMTHPENPILCISLREVHKPLRVVPAELWSIENNLSLGNMDFEEFHDAVADDGIFRGFN